MATSNSAVERRQAAYSLSTARPTSMPLYFSRVCLRRRMVLEGLLLYVTLDAP